MTVRPLLLVTVPFIYHTRTLLLFCSEVLQILRITLTPQDYSVSITVKCV